jgi:hypothetical protein
MVFFIFTVSHCFNFSLMLIMDGVPAALTQ